MSNSKTVRIYISNPKVLMVLVNMLRDMNIPFTELKAGKVNDGDIVITDNISEVTKLISGRHVHIIRVEGLDNDELINTIERIKCLLKSKNQYRILILGIDPGGKIGLVILGDNELCEASVYSSVRELLNEVKRALLHIPYEKAKIKIGNGERSAEVVYGILDLIDNNRVRLGGKEVTIELVDETRTYNIPAIFKSKTGNIPKDVISALNIAIRKGLVIEGK